MTNVALPQSCTCLSSCFMDAGGELHAGQLSTTSHCLLYAPESCCDPAALQANMHTLASELERVKTELNDRTAMMGVEMERWRQQADATSTRVLLHHVRVLL